VRKGLFVVIVLSLISASSPVALAVVKPGTPCNKIGQSITSSGIKYTCTKSGKKLIWNKGKAVAVPVANSPSTPAPSPTPIPRPSPSPTAFNTNVVTEATRFIQSLIDRTSISSTSNKTKIVMHVESGKNGQYPENSEKALSVALNFYASLGMALPQDTIHVLLGRTQSWLREKANLYAPGCVDNLYKFAGSASLCAYPNRSAIYSHLPTAVTMAIAAPDDIDLSNLNEMLRYTNKTVIENATYGAAAHEAHHAWQDGSYGNSQAVPKWLWEGGASIFSEMVAAKISTSDQIYLRLDPGSSGGWSKKDCMGPVETMKPVCEYTQGIVVMEYFLFRFGVDSYVNLITKGNNLAFPTRFENATKASLSNFYADVNKYLSLKGWNY
jgi:hypothetical protein